MKLLLSSIAVFIILFLSFISKDTGSSAGLKAYSDEPKIYYRLARSEKQGIFSDAGLLGFCETGRGLTGETRKKNSISVYSTKECPDYYPYRSQSGFQGLIYSLIDKFYKDPFIFKILCASFLSAVLTAWFVWLSVYFGLIPSFLIMMSILLFDQLIFFGDNIAQVLGATYLIMVAMFWTYEKKIANIGTVAFIVVLLKTLLSGPEYIFSALLLPFLPVIFYAVLNQKPFPKVIQEIFLIIKGVVLACFVSILILMAQVSVLDSPAGAMHYFIGKTMERTFFSNWVSADGRHIIFNLTTSQLSNKYLSYTCTSIGPLRISFGVMILFFCLISVLTFYLYRRCKQRSLLALFITTWASILCPLSWIFIAKGHSMIEAHDDLVWHIPFTLLGMALTVVTLKTWIIKNNEP